MTIVLALPILAQAETEDGERGFGRGWGGPKHGGRRGPDPGRFIDRHGDELGLDAEARESIQAIVDESRSRAEQIRGEIRGGHEAMRALLSESTPDEDVVMAQHDRIEALKSKQRRNRLESMLAIRKLLTPEQREQLIGMREGWRRGRVEGRRFGDEDGPGGGDWPGKGRHGPLAGCREDVANLCSESEPGRARLQCLDAEWENLSDDCRAAFEGRGRLGPRANRCSDSDAE
jgi:Spy/CpxP family protein refolding chaperone